MDKKLEAKFEYNREHVSELRSEAVLRLGIFTEVDGSSIFFCRIELLGSSQVENVVTNDFRRKDFDFIATALVRGGDDNGNGGRAMLYGSSVGKGRRMIGRATGIGDRGGL